MCLPVKTWITGLAPGVSKVGMVVDPLNLTGSFGPKNSAATQPDPATERASAEAEAAQRANAQLAESNRRRREQGSLMSKGATAPTFSMGDATTDPGSNTLSATGATTRSTTATRASLMSRGAASVTTGGGATYGGVGRLQQAVMR